MAWGQDSNALQPPPKQKQTRRAVIKRCTKIYRKVDFTIFQRGGIEEGAVGGS